MKKENNNKMMLQKPSGSIAISDNTTAMHRKVYNVLLYKARKELEKDQSKTLFFIKVSEIKKFYGIRNKNNVYLKNLLYNLTKTTIEFNILNKDNSILWGAFSLLPYVAIKNDEKTNELIVEYEIPTPVRKSIISKKGIYGKIDMFIIKQLNSKYAIILYELIKDYENVEIPEMDINTFKKLFGIEGKYKDFYNIKRRILKPAIEEINSNPNIDWKIEVELIKNGNKYTYIKFSKIKKVLPTQSKIELLINFVPEPYRKVAKKIIKKYINVHDINYISYQINYMNNQEEIYDYCEQLEEAIKNNYAMYNSEYIKPGINSNSDKKNKEYNDSDLFKEAEKIWENLSEEKQQTILQSMDIFTDNHNIKRHKAILDIVKELKELGK